MANVADENTPGAGSGGVATTERPERSERTDKGTLKARPREDDDQIDPAEYARLLDSYDNSFRNIAEEIGRAHAELSHVVTSRMPSSA